MTHTHTQSAVPSSIREHALELINRATSNRNVAVIPRVFVDMFHGDHNAAMVLNQLLYWTDRTSDTEGWFYKTYTEWHKELGLSPYQMRRVINGDPRVENPKPTLMDIGLEVKRKRAPCGSPVIHYRLDLAIFFDILVNHLESQYQIDVSMKNSSPAQPEVPEIDVNSVDLPISTESILVNQQCDLSSVTENTTKNTTDNDPPTPVIRETILTETVHPSAGENTFMFLRKYEKYFGKLDKRALTSFKITKESLGESRLKQVLERCVGRGYTWAYVLKSLKNEQFRHEKRKSFVDYDISDDYLLSDELNTDPPPLTTKKESESALYISPNLDRSWETTFSVNEKTVKGIWEVALSMVEPYIGASNYNTYLRRTTLVDFIVESNCLVLAAHTAYARDFCEYNLYRTIHRVLAVIAETEIDIKFVTRDDWLTQHLDSTTSPSENAHQDELVKSV